MSLNRDCTVLFFNKRIASRKKIYFRLRSALQSNAASQALNCCCHCFSHFSGQICFCIYIAAQMVARLTISLAFFSTAELPKEEDSLYPVISLYPASIICIVIFVIHFLVIGCFKYLNVPEFMEGSDYDRFIHVLANTLVSFDFLGYSRSFSSWPF